MPSIPLPGPVFIDQLVAGLIEGDVETDIGRFTLHIAPGRTGRNPRIGAPIHIAGRAHVVLLPSDTFHRAALEGLDWVDHILSSAELAEALELPPARPSSREVEGLGSFGVDLRAPRGDGWLGASVHFRPDPDLEAYVDTAWDAAREGRMVET